MLINNMYGRGWGSIAQKNPACWIPSELGKDSGCRAHCSSIGAKANFFNKM